MTTPAQPTIVPPVNVMLDIETYGLAPGSVIKTIGAVKFALVNGTPTILDRFYRRIDAASAMRAGLTMDGPTVEWWLLQDERARVEMTMQGEAIGDVMKDFDSWLRGAEPTDLYARSMPESLEVWGNGASFDNVLVACAHQAALGQRPAWAHRRSLCYRTVKNANRDLPIDAHRVRTHHNALDDAESQAMHLMAIWQRDEKRKRALMLITEMVSRGRPAESADWWHTAVDLVNDMPTPSDEWKAEIPE